MTSIFKSCIITFVISLFSYYSIGQSPKAIQKTITPQCISNHVHFLASDSLLGRDTPSEGLDIAASYIANEFKTCGLEPVNGSYFEPIPLRRTKLGDNNNLVIKKDTAIYSLELKKDYVPFEYTATKSISGKVVFAGYGITAQKYNYDDYSNIDVTGKIVVILDHEPGEDDSASVFDGLKLSEYGSVKYKVRNAINHHAAGVIILTDPLNHIFLKPVGFPWPTLSRLIPDNVLPIRLSDKNDTIKIPVVHGGKSIIEIIFGDKDSLINIQKKIDQLLQPNSFAINEMSIELTTSLKEEEIHANNVVGFLPGSEPKLKDEILIIGAHYDHVGYTKNSKPDVDSVFNGADDNASGTSALMGVAKAFSTTKKPPRRSVLFVAFAAEEIGLYGSKAYVEDPLFPLNKTVAMLNLDMVGRNHPDSLSLHEGILYPKLSNIVKKQNKKYKTYFILEDLGYSGGSDHAPFESKSIPNLFFFSGLHNDYHTVRDNPEYVNYTKVARASRLCFGTAWFIANDNSYY